MGPPVFQRRDDALWRWVDTSPSDRRWRRRVAVVSVVRAVQDRLRLQRACEMAADGPAHDDAEDGAAEESSKDRCNNNSCWPCVRVLYGSQAHHERVLKCLRAGADVHMMRMLLSWCNRNGVIINPCVIPQQADGEEAVFRDYDWVVDRDLPPLTPLFAIPERLCIGFKDTDSQEELANVKRGTTSEAQTAIDDVAAQSSAESDADICAFFFNALTLLVNDVLVAMNNPVSDTRHGLAVALGRTRTAHNAPYLDSSAFASPDAELANVFLQMIHNYVASGPLTGKVERDMLNWATSISLSHSTPLTIAGRRSLGIVPLVHLVPHGAASVNAVVVARQRVNDGAALHHFFADVAPYMTGPIDEEMVYVVTATRMERGDRIAMQAMSPVCNRTQEAEDMWRLTCGEAPPEGSVSSAEYQEIQASVTRDVIRRGVALLR